MVFLYFYIFLGYEKQWRRICPECEAPLAYQCRPYEKKFKEGEFLDKNIKYYLYVYPKALISSIGDCKVAQEVAKLSNK